MVSTDTRRSFRTILSINSVRSADSNHFEVEAMLVPEGNEYLDPPNLESIRRHMDAIKADAVLDMDKRREIGDAASFCWSRLHALVVGLSFELSRQSGNGSVDVFEQSTVPTVTASDSPSAAPTIFTTALCVPMFLWRM
jgi:hypothetical protein